MSAAPSARPTVVLTQRVHHEVLDLLGGACTVVANQGPGSLPADELAHRLREADALIAFMPDLVDAALLAAGPRLRVVAGALKGYDNIDVAACSARGIWVTNCPDLLTAPTAELAVGLAIALMRHITAGDAVVRAGHPGWRPALYGRSLIGAQVGLYGMGSVGRAIARLLAGFGCRLSYHDPAALTGDEEARLAARRVSVEALLRGSDVVIAAAPLTAASRHALDAAALALMRPAAVLVNIGRGSVVDEDAVAAALADGRLAGYAADVFAFEDWALPDRPRAVPAALLAQVERTVFTPHLGSAVGAVRLAIEREAALNVLAALRGEHPHGAVDAVRPQGAR